MADRFRWTRYRAGGGRRGTMQILGAAPAPPPITARGGRNGILSGRCSHGKLELILVILQTRISISD